MSEQPQQLPVPGGAAAAGTAGAASPGSRLRQAREAAGLDLETLAANLRVAAAKLELLEADRHAELPDPAFARALALTVCRALHIDPAPVLAGLPQAQQGPRLEQVNQGLNQPFGPRRPWLGAVSRLSMPSLQAPAAALALLLVLAALVVYFWPQIQDRLARSAPAERTTQSVGEPVSPDVLQVPQPPQAASVDAAEAAGAETRSEASAPSAQPAAMPSAGATTDRASTASAAAAEAPGAATAVVPATPAAPQMSGALASAPLAAGTAPLLLRASAPSWVEVRDASGRSLLSRQLAAGETVSLAGTAPWRVRIGNAGGTMLSLRGQAVDLAPHTRNNVARLDLN